MPGTYTFRLHADYGLGAYIGTDGSEFTGGNTWGHVEMDPVSLSAGEHEFESLVSQCAASVEAAQSDFASLSRALRTAATDTPSWKCTCL